MNKAVGLLQELVKLEGVPGDYSYEDLNREELTGSIRGLDYLRSKFSQRLQEVTKKDKIISNLGSQESKSMKSVMGQIRLVGELCNAYMQIVDTYDRKGLRIPNRKNIPSREELRNMSLNDLEQLFMTRQRELPNMTE